MTTDTNSLADHYRLARTSWRDVGAIYRLQKAVFPQDALSWPEVLFLLLWPGFHNLKALSPGGEVAGYVCGGRLPVGSKIWIMMIGVHPAHQRRGLGRRLLTASEETLDGSAIYLTVRASNTPASMLYQQAGYRQVRVKRRWYPGGEDGIEMRKDRL